MEKWSSDLIMMQGGKSFNYLIKGQCHTMALVFEKVEYSLVMTKNKLTFALAKGPPDDLVSCE